MKFILNKDGSFNIYGKNFSLRNAYPSLNGISLHPIRTEISYSEIIYMLETGEFRIHFYEESNDVLRIESYITGNAGIHDVEIVGNCAVQGFTDVFRQSYGMTDPSGWNAIAGDRSLSHGLIALYSGAGALTIYAVDHTRFSSQFSATLSTDIYGEKLTTLTAGFNMECAGSAHERLPALYLREGVGLEDTLRASAVDIAAYMNARKNDEPAFHWCSWYYLYQNLTQEILDEYLEKMKREDCCKFRYFQIDAGYCRSLGDWLIPNHRFPEGMKKAADSILDAGFGAGIWIGPFMVGDQSNLYLNHPEWLLRNKDGSLVVMLRSYSEPKTWGNLDSNYYVLDMTHPDAKTYISHVFRTFREYGFTFFKTDFMLWNMHDSSKVERFDNSRTSVEIMRDTLKLIREAIGEESYLLGCIAPFMPFIGFADGMRISGDMGAQWDGEYSPSHMLDDICADQYFNQVFWQNDPDSVILRDFDTFFSDRETESLALLQAVSGGVITTSEPVHRISETRKRLLRFITPKGMRTGDIPFLGRDTELICVRQKLSQGQLIYVLNPTGHEISDVYPVEEITGRKKCFIYRYDLLSEDIHSENVEFLHIKLTSHESALYFITERVLKEKPENMWDWKGDEE